LIHYAPILLAELDFRTLPEQLVNGLFLGAIYALIALGYTMVYGVLRLINFAHGEVYMLGAYTSLLVSYKLGFGPETHKADSSVWNLLIMLLASMIVCAIVGVLIERFAYRPMRNHSRISALITAIGVSLFIQYFGALFLPNSPPPSISENVNPYRGSKRVVLIPANKALQDKAAAAIPAATKADADYASYKTAHPKEDEFNLSPAGQTLKDAKQTADRNRDQAQDAADNSALSITLRYGEVIIFFTSIVLMGILTYLVMFSKPGRAMRAVSHDFDSAALMGINVNNIITFTFILGSSLAGAGAMMQATLKGTTITTFFGLLPGVKAFVAAVLGGIGNIPGAVLGGVLMGIAETLVTWAGYSRWSDAVAFVILIVILLLRPGGLLGSSKVEKV
jgi:branched-chain amino acid transport system permease protein